MRNRNHDKRAGDPTGFSPTFATQELTWELSTQWTLTAVNHGLEGQSAGELLAAGYPGLRKLLASDQPSTLDAAILRASRRKAPVPVVQTSSSDRRYITSIVPLFDARQRVVGIECHSRDVTLLHQIESSRERDVTELAALSYMAAQVGTPRTVRELLRLLLRVALDVIGGENGCIVVATPQQQFRIGLPPVQGIRLLGAWASKVVSTMIEETPAKAREVLRIYSKEMLPRSVRRTGVNSVAVLPVRLRGQLVGVMALGSSASLQALADLRPEMLFAAHYLELSLRGLRDAGTAGSLEEQRQRVLREFTLAFSRGKMVILSDRELADLRHDAQSLAVEHVGEYPIAHPTDVTLVRRLTESAGLRSGFNAERVAEMAVSVTEAATNVVRHGRSGRFTLYRMPDRLQVWLEDRGTGIDLMQLARMALLRNYSLRSSMGLGFNMMIELSDRVLIHTTRHGTTLILEVLAPSAPDHRDKHQEQRKNQPELSPEQRQQQRINGYHPPALRNARPQQQKNGQTG